MLLLFAAEYYSRAGLFPASACLARLQCVVYLRGTGEKHTVMIAVLSEILCFTSEKKKTFAISFHYNIMLICMVAYSIILYSGKKLIGISDKKLGKS